MVESDLKIIEECRIEITKYQKMIDLTKELIELTRNKNKYGNINFLSDFIEELENHIKTYEFSIKERLFRIYGLA